MQYFNFTHFLQGFGLPVLKQRELRENWKIVLRKSLADYNERYIASFSTRWIYHSCFLLHLKKIHLKSQNCSVESSYCILVVDRIDRTESLVQLKLEFGDSVG